MSKSIGLALGGGGAKGWAHIGVLRALEEHNIPIHRIAGTSIGALVGAIYVRGELSKLEQFAQDANMENLVPLMDVSFPGLGLVDGQKVREFLKDYLVDAVIEEAQIPFRCVATNFLLKEEVIFESGSMVDAVRASISLPGIFVPFKHQSGYLVDGGVVNPVPVSVVKAMGADVIIAVNLNRDPQTLELESQQKSASNKSPEPSSNPKEQGTEQSSTAEAQKEADLVERVAQRYESLKGILKDQIDDWMPDPSTGMNIFDVIGNSINLMEEQVTHIRLKIDVPDVLIEPDLAEYNIFDFQEAQPMIQRGYEAAKAAIPQIEEAIAADKSN